MPQPVVCYLLLAVMCSAGNDYLHCSTRGRCSMLEGLRLAEDYGSG